MKVTVDDVLNDPEFSERLAAEVAEIDRKHDLWEYRYCSERGMPISKALWRRLKKRRG